MLLNRCSHGLRHAAPAGGAGNRQGVLMRVATPEAEAPAFRGFGAAKSVSKPSKSGGRKTKSKFVREPAWQAGVPTWVPEEDTIGEKDILRAQQIKRRFLSADHDGNGRIDREELRALLESQGSHIIEGAEHWMSEAEVDRVLSRYDRDRSGDLSLEEFEQLMWDGLLLDDTLCTYKAAFDQADAEALGSLSVHQLRGLLSSLGSRADEAGVVNMMRKYDGNRNGRLEFHEFMQLAKDHMLDVSQVLAYLGARPQHDITTQSVIQAITPENEVTLIGAESELDQLLLARPGQLTVLMTGMTFCRSCRAMMQHFRHLAAGYQQTGFAVLFGDASPASKVLFRDRLKVRSTPAFFFFRDGQLVGSLTGGNVGRLEAELRKRSEQEEVPDAVVFAALAAPYL